MAADEPQQLVLKGDSMNRDTMGSLEAQVDVSNWTPSPPNEPDYAYIFIFLINKMDINTWKTDELRNENAALRSAINEITDSNATTKQTPPAEPQREIPITPRILFYCRWPAG